MDPILISNIIKYYPITKSYNLSKELKHRIISKNILFTILSSRFYLLLKEESRINLIQFPSQTSKLQFEYNSDDVIEGIEGFVFIYKSGPVFNSGKTVKCIDLNQLSIFSIQLGNVRKELSFFRNSNKTFTYNLFDFAVIEKGSSIFLIKDKRILLTYTLSYGIIYDEVYISYSNSIEYDRLVSNTVGECLTVQLMNTGKIYKTKFKSQVKYQVLSSSFILVEMTDLKDSFFIDLLPKSVNNLKISSVLFKYYLVDGIIVENSRVGTGRLNENTEIENKISLEYVRFFEFPMEIEIISYEKGIWYSKQTVNSSDYVNIYRNDRMIKEVQVQDGYISIVSLMGDRLLLEYETFYIVFSYLNDSSQDNYTHKIDMMNKIPFLYKLGTLSRYGDYYHLVCVVYDHDKEEEKEEENDEIDENDENDDEGNRKKEICWKNYILDMGFNIIYEVDDDWFHCFYCQ